MTLDRNKTELTHTVTNAAQHWLGERGFKPVETEVMVDQGWCADLAGVICPTETELIKLKLLPRKPGWNERYSLKFTEEQRAAAEQRYAVWSLTSLNFQTRSLTCLVEVKTSRGDFRGDRKWTATLPTDLAYLAVPKGLIKPEEWPVGWGILEVGENGARQVRPATPVEISHAQQRDVILNIAIRRDHHTRYGRWREEQKEQRVREADRRAQGRFEDIAKAVLSVVRGDRTPEEAMLFCDVKSLSEWTMDKLRVLHGIRPDLEAPHPLLKRRRPTPINVDEAA